MSRSIIWRGAVWLVIAMMWGSVASAAAHSKSSHPEVLPSSTVELGDIPSVSPPDQKGNFEAVATVAVAAIDAARHSTEESKQFYEGYSQLLVWAAAVIAALISALGALGSYGGFVFLKSRAEKIAAQTATKTAKSMLDAKVVQIDSIIKKATDEMDQIKTNLTEHIQTYDAFNDGMRAFRDQTTADLAAFLTVIPQSLELAFWIGQHGRKALADPTRPDPQATARLVLEVCATALRKDPKQNDICAYIYGYDGVAHRLLGNYAKAYDSLDKCRKYNNDYANTLYNMACCSCLLGRADEAKQHLRYAISQQPRFAEGAYKDSDFATLLSDPEFLEIVGKPDQGKRDAEEPGNEF